MPWRLQKVAGTARSVILASFPHRPDAVAKLIRKLADRYETLQVCYESGTKAVIASATSGFWRLRMAPFTASPVYHHAPIAVPRCAIA
jgi:hypothetical protein